MKTKKEGDNSDPTQSTLGVKNKNNGKWQLYRFYPKGGGK